jgi:predicted Zn-dependent protease
LLALTALREQTPEVARAQLTELVAEFPENSLFASELAKLSAANQPLPSGITPKRHAVE